MKLRPYTLSDTPTLISLFRKTVHTVCVNDYSQEQLDAWAPDMIDVVAWEKRLSSAKTVVVESDSHVLGFGSLKSDGCIDMLYVASEAQGRGVALLILKELESTAVRGGMESLYSDVSLTARAFFLKHGFRIEREYEKSFNGLVFSNAIMRKFPSNSLVK